MKHNSPLRNNPRKVEHGPWSYTGKGLRSFSTMTDNTVKLNQNVIMISTSVKFSFCRLNRYDSSKQLRVTRLMRLVPELHWGGKNHAISHCQPLWHREITRTFVLVKRLHFTCSDSHRADKNMCCTNHTQNNIRQQTLPVLVQISWVYPGDNSHINKK